MHMRGMALFISLCVLIVVLAGCATTPGALPSGKTEAGEGTGATAGEQTVRSADCPVTTPITITPPDSKYRDPLPRGAYYASADEMILVPSEEWGQGSRKIRLDQAARIAAYRAGTPSGRRSRAALGRHFFRVLWRFSVEHHNHSYGGLLGDRGPRQRQHATLCILHNAATTARDSSFVCGH